MITESICSAGQNRYISGAGFTSVGSGTWQYTIGARISAASLAALADAPSAGDTSKVGFYRVLKGDPLGGGRFPAVCISFMSSVSGADVDFRLFQVKRGNDTTTDYTLECIGYGTYTCATAFSTGTTASTVLRSNEYVAEKISYTAATAATTPKGVSAFVNSLLGSPGAVVHEYGTGTAMPAILGIPELASAEGIYIAFSDTAGTVCNAIIEPIS